MVRRPSLLAAFMLGASLTVLALGNARGGGAQEGPAPSVEAGRFAMDTVVDDARKKYVVVVDTATGRCWWREIHPSATRWIDMGSPVATRDRGR